MSTVAERLLTAEAFWHSPENGKHRHLVRGEVVETMPPGGMHGLIAVALAGRLQSWAKRGPGGCVGVESGFILARDPDTVRGPDVFYVSADRIPKTGIPEAFWNLAPDLAVEVISPDETANEILEKIADFHAAGTSRVWVVYPRRREVVIHHPDGSARTVGGNDVLEDQEILPGFTCRVAELFAE